MIVDPVAHGEEIQVHLPDDSWVRGTSIRTSEGEVVQASNLLRTVNSGEIAELRDAANSLGRFRILGFDIKYPRDGSDDPVVLKLYLKERASAAEPAKIVIVTEA